MVNKKPEKVEKKSVPKKKSAVKKDKTVGQKKKSPVKKTTVAKAKKPVAKKVTKKTAVKKVSSVKKVATTKAKKPTLKKTVKKTQKKAATEKNVELKIKTATKNQRAKVENVIDKLSRTKEQNYVTTVPGVLRKVPAAQKSPTQAHKQLPIEGILNYIKGIF